MAVKEKNDRPAPEHKVQDKNTGGFKGPPVGADIAKAPAK